MFYSRLPVCNSTYIIQYSYTYKNTLTLTHTPTYTYTVTTRTLKYVFPKMPNKNLLEWNILVWYE